MVPSHFFGIGSFITKKSCSVRTDDSEWTLHSATFDCDILSPCQLTCIGPHKEKLRRVSKECGCITEWFFHSIWLQTFISLMVFALLNISRLGFVDGLARVLWKSLHPGAFTVRATCDEKGKFMETSTLLHIEKFSVDTNHDKQSQLIRFNGEIKKQIDWNSFVFRMSGAIMMIIALSLNAVWILLILKIPDATRPKWLY